MRKKIIFRSVVLIVVVLIAWKIYIGIRDVTKASHESLPSTYTLPNEYLGLVSKKYSNRLTVKEIYQHTFRNPVSLLYYNSNFGLSEFEINLEKTESLTNILQIENSNSAATTGVTYRVIFRDFFNLNYKSGEVNQASVLYLTLWGDSLSTVHKSDSLVSFHLLCKNLSIRYGEKEPIDIYMAGEEGFFGITKVIPMDILFLQRDRKVFLILMTPRNPNDPISPALLYNIVTGN